MAINCTGPAACGCHFCAPPEVDYPEDHSPFCHRDCTHPCHDAYDEWAAKNGSYDEHGDSNVG